MCSFGTVKHSHIIGAVYSKVLSPVTFTITRHTLLVFVITHGVENLTTFPDSYLGYSKPTWLQPAYGYQLDNLGAIQAGFSKLHLFH